MMEKALDYIKGAGFWGSIIAIVIGVFLYLVFKRVINKYFMNGNKTISKKKLTYQRLFRNILKYVVIVIVIIVVLEINGVNIKSILAGLGIVSVIAGLALQDALKDIIMGFNLITDDYFFVDDVIKIGEKEGKVLSIGLKNTKLRDVNTGDVFIIANRNISEAMIESDYLGIDLPLSYEDDLKKIEKFIDKILKEIIKMDYVEKAEYRGIENFEDSSILYRLVLFVKPEHKMSVKRKVNRLIKMRLDEEGISIPYPQLDVHNKK